MHLFSAILMALIATTGAAETITAARFADPTLRYAHGVLGDSQEWGALEIDATVVSAANGRDRPPLLRKTTYIFRLPLDHVFEDITPRLADVTGDGLPEVLVIETDVRQGGALAIYDSRGKIAETPHIGRTHRWLAPLGAADLDGDGIIEIAYIDRPHLARTLRIWRFENNTLTHVADQPGLTNHRIGEDHISGGIRHCGGPPEIITVNPDWTRLIASTLSNVRITTRDISPHTGPASFTAALACQ